MQLEGTSAQYVQVIVFTGHADFDTVHRVHDAKVSASLQVPLHECPNHEALKERAHNARFLFKAGRLIATKYRYQQLSLAGQKLAHDYWTGVLEWKKDAANREYGHGWIRDAWGNHVEIGGSTGGLYRSFAAGTMD